MQYKTIVLEFLQQRPEIYEQLRKEHKLHPTMELYAQELKRNHEAWKQELSRMMPESDQQQITSEALELALEDLKGCLDSEFPAGENEAPSLDDAMAFIRRRTPPA